MRQAMTNTMKCALVLAAGLMAGACTITDTTPPPLTGPSEMSLSLAISASPDVLPQDGGSQSVITIDAKDPNAQAVANQLLYIEIEGGDFGTLSARTVVTNNQGRASFTYTAPPGTAADTTQNVAIRVRPSGTDNASQLSRIVNIRLNPSGTIGTGLPVPSFTFLPTAPLAFDTVRFDGSGSTASRGATIVSYTWDFGDGNSGTGAQPTHEYDAAGSYGVRLTVTDSQGISATSAMQVVEVGASTPPTAVIVFSPTEPAPNQSVFFNGTTSTAASGRRIVSYRWSFGDGGTGSGSSVSHKYTAIGTYVVVLTVRDDAGQTATATTSVTVE